MCYCEPEKKDKYEHKYFWPDMPINIRLEHFKRIRKTFGKDIKFELILQSWYDASDHANSFLIFNGEDRGFYKNDPALLSYSNFVYYAKLRDKANAILYRIRRPNAYGNFKLGKRGNKEQLKRIITRLRNQYEQLISTIPNSFL